jgi:hypothetical protein
MLAPLTAMEIIEDPATSGSVTVRDGKANVMSYQYGDQLKEGVDAKYTRSCYIHPLWSADGKVLTDDFPKDHFHHRGIYWAWPWVETRGVQTETWHPHEKTLRQHFVRWIDKQISAGKAILRVENRWVLEEEETVAKEDVSIVVHPIAGGGRAIDINIKLEAVGGPLMLKGSPQDNKGYGGLCFRAAPDFQGGGILTDAGPAKEDLVNQARKWSAISSADNSVAVFPALDHPAFPPHWMVRNSYTGFINVSWPALSPVTLEPGRPVVLEYRVWVKDGIASEGEVEGAYNAYIGEAKGAGTVDTTGTVERR